MVQSALIAAMSLVVLHDDAVRITRNYSQEHNEAVLAMPPSERAYPLYLEALRHQAPWPGEEESSPARHIPVAGDERWAAAVAWVQANGRTIELIREAARRPHVGLLWSDAVDPDYAAAKGQEFGQASENPPLVHVQLPHLGDLRSFVRLIRLDATVAIAGGESGRWRSDVETMLALGSQAASGGSLIEHLVGIASLSLACKEVGRVLIGSPERIADADLTLLASAFDKALTSEAMEVTFRMERLVFDDLLQRAYTDDGAGDGTFAIEGARLIAKLTADAGEERDDLAVALWFSTISPEAASRREAAVFHHDLLDRAEAVVSRPLWDQRFEEWEAEKAALSTRFPVSSVILPEVVKARLSCEQIRIELGGTRVAIALEQFRRARGAYPSSLADLVPRELAEVPIDRFTGRPLLYHLQDGKPLVYAAGVDGDDDAGRPMTPSNAPFPTGRGWRALPPGERPDGDYVLFPEPVAKE